MNEEEVAKIISQTAFVEKIGNDSNTMTEDQREWFRSGIVIARQILSDNFANYFAGESPEFNRGKFIYECDLHLRTISRGYCHRHKKDDTSG